jgi:hypothetical protein
MKKVLIIVVCAVGVIALALGITLRLTAGTSAAADRFFQTVAQGDLEQAYASTAEEFRASTTLEELRAFLEENALIQSESTKWHSRSVSGAAGELEGVVKTKTGGTIPLKVSLVKEKEAWRIRSIMKAEGGVVTESRGKEIPPQEILVKLCDESLAEFAAAVNARDFSGFHASIAKRWQADITKEELLAAFKSFCDQQVDLTVLRDLDPVFDEEPSSDESGSLTIKGHYPTEPSVVHFNLGYEYEHPDWKLIRIDVSAKTPEASQ